MSLLRMLAFRPDGGDGAQVAPPVRDAAARVTPSIADGPVPQSTRGEPGRPSGGDAAARAAAALKESARAEATEPPQAAREPEPRAAERSAPAASPTPAFRAEPDDDADGPELRAVAAAIADIGAGVSAAPAPAPSAAPGRDIADADAWHALVAGSELKGPARQLAEHAGFIGYANGVLRLSLSPEDELLGGAATVKLVADALAPMLGRVPQIRFETAAVAVESLRERNERARDARQAAAEEAFMGNADVQRLVSQHGARVVPDSIRPFEES